MINSKHIALLLLFGCELLAGSLIAQTNNLYGTISDANTGEQLAGCSVYLVDKSKGIVSNAYGYYSVELPKGKNTVVYSYLGYIADTITIVLHSDSGFNISLNQSIAKLTSVEIEAQLQNNVEGSQNIVTVESIKKMPAAMGEPDVMKSLQLLPGVQTTTEGTTNLSIRGGTHDQNLILLDEAPVYNPSHVLSLVSAFNIDALKGATIYKGYFPAQYGGRLSSVVELRMKEGNNQKFALSGGLSLIASRLTIEVPVIKNRTSIMLSGRYGYPGRTLNGIYKLNTIPQINITQLNHIPEDNVVWFYDLNFKLNHTINDKNKIYLSSYISKDEFEFSPLEANSNIKWGNRTFTGRWNHIQNSKMFINYTFLHSNYNYEYKRIDGLSNYKWNSGLQETSFKIDADYFLNTKNHLKFGGDIGFNKYAPGTIGKTNEDSDYREFTLHPHQTIKANIYISDKYKLNSKIQFNLGIRYSSMMNIGEDEVFVYNTDKSKILDTNYYSNGEIFKHHHGLEPRISVSYLYNQSSSFHLSYSRTMQYVHLLSNSAIGLPTDVWIPANTNIAPANANQYAIGFNKSFKKTNLKASVELYYRDINNIIDFVDNADLFLNERIETQILSGKRKAYGIEFMLKKETGNLKGWISYTLSKTEQKVEGVNNNNWYPAYFDKRHSLAVFMSYKVLKVLELGAVFKFSSGGNITVPLQVFYFQGQPVIEYSARNAYQLPNYHRLDLSLTYKAKKNSARKWKNSWTIGVYNIYNRKNVFAIEPNSFRNQSTDLNIIYLYGIVPYLSYQFKF